jgi:hypothetical protein
MLLGTFHTPSRLPFVGSGADREGKLVDPVRRPGHRLKANQILGMHQHRGVSAVRLRGKLAAPRAEVHLITVAMPAGMLHTQVVSTGVRVAEWDVRVARTGAPVDRWRQSTTMLTRVDKSVDRGAMRLLA